MFKPKITQTTLPIRPGVKPEKGEELTQKAYLNVVAAMVSYFVTGVTSFIVNPFMVTGLGSTHYGILQIVQQTSTFMTAADGRPIQALKWFIANLQDTTDHTAKKQAIGSAMVIWLMFSPIVLIVGGILIWFTPLITQVSSDLFLMVRVAMVFYIIDILISGIAMLPDAVLRGMNLSYRRLMLAPFFTILSGILTVIAVKQGFSVPGVAFAALLTDFIMGMVWWGIIRNLLPWFGTIRPDTAKLRQFIAVSGWFFAWTLINKIILNGDIVALGIVAGPDVVTTYALTGYVARMVVELSALATGAITPGLGRFISGERFAEARTIRHEMLNINWLLCVSVGATILLWNKSFLGLWVGTEYYGGIPANLMIVLTVVQLTLIRNDAFIIDVTLQLRRKVLLGGLSAILSLGLAAILIQPFGIVGLCLGLLIGRSVLSIGYPVIISSLFTQTSQPHLTGVIRPVTVTIVLFITSTYLSQSIFVKNWLQFFALGGLSFVFALSIALAGGLSMYERKAIIERVSRIRLFGGA